MKEDALWYEAASVVGVTNALNVVADGLPAEILPPVAEPGAGDEARPVLDEIRAFYGEIPAPFLTLARDPGYLTDLWGAVRHAFDDHGLTRRLKEALAFAVSLTSRSCFGTGLHLAQMRRLGVGEKGVMEVVGVTQMFSSYTKIADTLQLESDMRDIAPVDPTPAPGGSAPAAPPPVSARRRRR
jgi:alkylhydroperoxidase/carboxymuconolactone decarboxylase family protein YurZ